MNLRVWKTDRLEGWKCERIPDAELWLNIFPTLLRKAMLLTTWKNYPENKIKLCREQKVVAQDNTAPANIFNFRRKTSTIKKKVLRTTV